MIQVILGGKGSGKTKRLIDLTNDALKEEHGNIIFIDDDKRYMYDLRHEIRFVDAMLSADFDLSLIAVDAFKKLVKTDLDSDEMRDFFEQLDKLSEAHHCRFVLSISSAKEEVPEFIARYAL